MISLIVIADVVITNGMLSAAASRAGPRLTGWLTPSSQLEDV
ncbi:MAG: hypothetical protein WA188_13525 [Terriglobales bacterium]